MNSFEFLGLKLNTEPTANFRKINNACNLDYYGEEDFLKNNSIIFKKYKWLISPQLKRGVNSVYSENFYGCLGVFIFSDKKYILAHVAPSTFWDDTEKERFFYILSEQSAKLDSKFGILIFASRFEYFTESRYRKYFDSIAELLDKLSKKLRSCVQIKAKTNRKKPTHFLYDAQKDSAIIYQD